jgi:hypothetical protein
LDSTLAHGEQAAVASSTEARSTHVKEQNGVAGPAAAASSNMLSERRRC